MLPAYPTHLGTEFLTILEKLTKERLEAKAKGDKVKAESLKITVNSIFGKLGSEFSFTYDPTNLYKVTINGQFFILMLAERIYSIPNADIFYYNTKSLVLQNLFN